MKFSKHFNRPLTAVQQSERIKKKFSQFKVRYLRQNTGRWRGTLQPSDASESYIVEISLSCEKDPIITIIKPKLKIAPGCTELPHVYSGKKLCLHYPKNKEWASNKAIADTIIPWTSLWLLFYEYWLIDGDWLGGGKHHDGRDQDVA